MEINRVNNTSMESASMNKESLEVKIDTKAENEVTKDNTEKPTLKDVQKAVEKLNKFIEDEHIYAKYEMHDKFNQIMIKLINQDTKEIILEVPPKKILDMVAKMCEMVGVLIDKKA